MNDQRTPELPDPADRMPVEFADPPHPAILPIDVLLTQCRLRTQPRSGPGGQHRNRTSSGVFLAHEPTGIVGEATERRSQADNRSVALTRLRFQLAVGVRTPSALDSQSVVEEQLIRETYRGNLNISDRNEAKPAVLALLLNDLHAAGGQPSAVSPPWSCSTSAIVRLVKSHPPAFSLINRIREFHGRRPLK